jgi:hypothetical protein
MRWRVVLLVKLFVELTFARVTESAVQVAPIEPGELADAAESRARFHGRLPVPLHRQH